MKKILTLTPVKWLICFIVHKYCLFVFYTSKIHYQNIEYLKKITDQNDPIILAFWHGRLLFMPLLGKSTLRKNVYSVVSRHGDGALIVPVLKMFGLKLIRGSTNRSNSHEKGAKDRGGGSVLKESISVLKQGKIIAYTPDGPKGPKYEINETSMLNIAGKTEAKIIPLTVSSSKAYFINSWDNFMVPLPFGTILFTVGEALTIEKNASQDILENSRKILQTRLNTITSEADKGISAKI